MKKIITGIIMLALVLTVSGCFKSDTMENIKIYTTAYPIEYITNYLYGKNANVNSIYPNGTDINTYKLTSKQISDYSKSDLYIYNGLGDEKNYAVEMINKNRNLKIIDAALSMEYTNGQEELWLDPSNFLMLTQNIKNGLKEFISNPYLKNEIDNNYDNLKIKISEIDASLKLLAENTSNNTIVVADDLFLFLDKYNINVVSLQKNDDLTARKINDVKTLMANGTIKYIFIKPNQKLNSTIQNLIDTYKVQTLTFDTLSNLNEQQQTDKNDFISIMNNNIELLKMELYQ